MGNSTRKPKGWWSRRHETREAQDVARETYFAKKRGPNVNRGRRHRKHQR